MNILGEGFPDEIINQVKQRQKIYGSGYDLNSFRTPEQLVYLNANTAWCKLVSSTYIENSDIINNTDINSLGLGGDDLAKRFILFNGTSDINLQQRLGLNISSYNSNTVGYTLEGQYQGFNNAYGIGGSQFGINPMMGIQSATINHKNRGSIRTAVVNIKAWNKIQFDIIDILYLRLGFSVLLEWGNSMYYTSPNSDLSNSEFVSNPIGNSLASEFLEAKISYKDFLNKIRDKRLETYGNYDAMFAKVTNFHWSFKPDGSYDITLNLVSVGDVVESFKIKGNVSSVIPSNTSTSPQTLEEQLRQFAPSSEVANYLYNCIQAFKSPGNTSNSCFLYNTSATTDWRTYWDPNGTFASASNDSTSTKDVCVIVPPGGALGVPAYSGAPTSNYGYTVTATDMGNQSTPLTSTGTYQAAPTTPSTLPPQNSYFIRLGNLLQFIQEGLMYEITSANAENSNTPILNFDFNTETNLMHNPPQLMGYDPRIAMVRTVVQFLGGNVPVRESRPYFDITNGNKNGFAEQFTATGNNVVELGKIMNIYVNFQFILNKLKELENKDTNEVLLLDFLKGILAGINNSFGGYSKLDTAIDETTNTFKIIDQNPLPSINQAIDYVNSFGYSIPKNLAKFDLYGYNLPDNKSEPSSAGFIKEFEFTTELTPEFSIMITTAATSNGNVVGENNTALSRLNKGLYDKYKRTINGEGNLQETVDPNSRTAQDILKENYHRALNEFQTFATGFITYVDHLYLGQYVDEEIDNYKDSITIYYKLYKKFKKAANDYYNYDENNPTQGKEAVQFQPGTGFIPFNLSLKMNGLSGVKIGSRFLIDTSYLPSNYPSTVDFLIKNLSHEIKDNIWTTSVESYCIAKSPEAYTSLEDEVAVPPTNNTPSPNYPTATSQNYSNIVFKNIGLGNPSEDKINPNLLRDINTAAIDTGVVVSITTAVSGHRADTPTRHASGNAVDIAIIDNIAVRPRAVNRAKIDAFVASLERLGYVKNSESGNPKAVLTFGFPNHDNHVHVSNRI